MPQELPIYQVDAFADALFAGNPAAVMPLQSWLPADLMQLIAAENNLAETAFIVPDGDGYAIRWFTPTVEVPLCGHATLASAFVVFRFLRPGTTTVQFTTREAGVLTVAEEGDLLALDFPSRPPAPTEMPAGLAEALGLATPPEAILEAADNLLCVFATEAEVAALAPDFRLLTGILRHGLIATAPADGEIDFVSRFFAPAMGIDEDPATGAAHCTLIPYWSARLGRAELRGRQISARVGGFACTDKGPRVRIAGRAQLFLKGTVTLP